MLTKTKRFRTHGAALLGARFRSEEYGVRYRVIRQDYPNPGGTWFRWLIAPTPAPAPGTLVATEEPCS